MFHFHNCANTAFAPEISGTIQGLNVVLKVYCKIASIAQAAQRVVGVRREEPAGA